MSFCNPFFFFDSHTSLPPLRHLSQKDNFKSRPTELTYLLLLLTKKKSVVVAQPSLKIMNRWFPLESNPEVINKYLGKIGLKSNVVCTDIYSTEEWAIDMLPALPEAILCLFPMTENQESHRKEQGESLKLTDNVNNVKFFVEQRIGNACGTIGLLHALGNLPGDNFIEGGWLSKYFKGEESVAGKSNAERLESDPDIQNVHTEACEDESNANARGDLDQVVNNHFIAFAKGVDNFVYEFDGRKAGPGECET